MGAKTKVNAVQQEEARTAGWSGGSGGAKQSPEDGQETQEAVGNSKGGREPNRRGQ